MKNNRVFFIDETSSDASASQRVIEAGYELAGCYSGYQNLASKLAVSHADILVIYVVKPCHILLAELEKISTAQPLPIVIFAESSDIQWMNKSLNAGVSSYIYRGLEPIPDDQTSNRTGNSVRIRAILDMARLRFTQLQELKRQLQETQERLQNRVLVDKAKGMLMEYQNISEQQAYRALQKTAMDQATSIADIARQTITVLSNIQARQVRA